MNSSRTKERLVVLMSSYFKQRSGGAELQASYLCDRADEKYEVHYIFLSRNTPFPPGDSIILHPINRINIVTRLGNLKFPYGINILKLLNKIQPQYIYQRCASALTGIASFYARRNDCRLTFHIAHDRDVEIIPGSWRVPWLIPEYQLRRYGIQHADNIIAQTQFQAEKLERNFNREAVIIRNGHPVPEYCKKSNEKITIVWIANWKTFKQPEIFVQLAREIKLQKNVRFIMVGRTDKYDNLVNLANKHSIEVWGQISKNKVNELLEQSHILVNTSLQEGFSNTFIEAWMRQVPVVSLHVDPDNILSNRQIGFCASGDFKLLLQNTEKLIQNHDLRQQMGNRAREYAVRHHSMTNIDKIIETVTG